MYLGSPIRLSSRAQISSMHKHLLVLSIVCGLSSIVCEAQTYHVTIATNYGNIEVKLNDGTPHHRDNFLRLCQQGFYDSVLFHRVIKDFVVQAGDPDSRVKKDTAQLGNGDLGYLVPAEIKPDFFYHHRGALGMARDDNPAKASSACQFYIVQGKVADDSAFIKAKKRTDGYEIPEAHKRVYRKDGGIPHLDSRYTVFGEVTKGMEVVDSMALVQTDSNDRPKKPVRILGTTLKIVPKKLPFDSLYTLLQGEWVSNDDEDFSIRFNNGKFTEGYVDGTIFRNGTCAWADNYAADTLSPPDMQKTYLLLRNKATGLVQGLLLEALTAAQATFMNPVDGVTVEWVRKK